MNKIIDVKRHTRKENGHNTEILSISNYMSIKTVKGFTLWMGCMCFVSYAILKVSGLL